jgi:hypothetical protein
VRARHRSFALGGAMSKLQEFSDLVAEIYDASLDPSQWPSVLKKASRFVPGNHANIFMQRSTVKPRS